MTPVFPADPASALSLHSLAVALVQAGPNVDVAVGSPVRSVLGGAVGAFLTTLLVGAIMVAVAPDYTRERMAQVLEDPIASFGYGLVALVVVVFLALVLILTIIGILVAIPFLILAWVVWAVGAAIAFLAIADRLVGHEDGWTKPLLVAAGINGLLTVTGIGGLVSFCVGAAGFGAVLRDYLD